MKPSSSGMVAAGKIALVLFSFALAFATAEFVFRALPASERLGWVNVPSAAERAAAFMSARSSASGPVLVAFGDSFTEFRDPDGGNYVRVVERMARDEGRAVRVLNLGEAGTGLVQYATNFCFALERIEPNIALFGLYLGNDPFDADIQVAERTFERCSLVGPRSSTLTDVAKRSSLVNAIYRLGKVYIPSLRSGVYEAMVAQVPESLRRAYEPRLDPALVELAMADAINPWDVVTALQTPDIYRALYDGDAALSERLATFVESVGTIADRCRAHDVKCLFILIPPAPWVGPAFHDYFRRLGYDLPAGDGASVPVLGMLRSALKEREVTTFDLLPALRAASDRALFIPNDTHLSRVGQEVAGIAIYARLRDIGWL